PDIMSPLKTSARTYMVRLRAGVPPDVAERRLTQVARQVGSEFPPNWTGVHLASVHGRYTADLRPTLIAFTAATALVMLIVFANVAVLMLLRTVQRQKEIGIRLVLGAGRTHIVRTLALETFLLCAIAVLAGIGLTAVVLRTTAPLVEAHFCRPAPGGLPAAGFDPSALLIMVGVAILSMVFLTLLPMLPGWQRRFSDALRQEGRGGTGGPRARRLQSSLIAF